MIEAQERLNTPAGLDDDYTPTLHEAARCMVDEVMDNLKDFTDNVLKDNPLPRFERKEKLLNEVVILLNQELKRF